MEKLSKEDNEFLGYILDQIHQKIESNQEDIDALNERINILEREDKKSRVKIIIFLIVLIFTYLTACIPKLVTVIEALEKFL